MRNRPDNWYTKETDQKYMDAAFVLNENQTKIQKFENLLLCTLLAPHIKFSYHILDFWMVWMGMEDISTLEFSTPSFNPGIFNPWLFNLWLFNHLIFKPKRVWGWKERDWSLELKSLERRSQEALYSRVHTSFWYMILHTVILEYFKIKE